MGSVGLAVSGVGEGTTTDEAPLFHGHGGDCGEHRTVGPHRAWCYACQEWCYPSSCCTGCADTLYGDVAEVATERDDLGRRLAEAEGRIAAVTRMCDEAITRGQASLPKGMTLTGVFPLAESIPASRIRAALTAPVTDQEGHR